MTTGLQINVTYDASVANAPADFTAAVNAAVQFFEQTFTNNITINIDVGWGEVGGQALDPSAVAENLSTPYYTTYQALRSALAITDTGSPAAALAVAGLSGSDPTDGATLRLTAAEAQALGLITSTGIDGYVGVSSTQSIDFDPSNRAVAGQFDAVGAIEHEISEILGRSIYAGGASAGAPTYSALDLFRYSAADVHSYQPGSASFALNGDLLLNAFNTAQGGDIGDWATSATADPFDAFETPGVQLDPSTVDIRVLELLGYTVNWSAPTPNGVPVSPLVVSQTVSLGDGQSLDFDGPAAIVFSPTSSQTGPAYTNSGTISDDGSASQVDVVGVRYDPAATATLAAGVASTFTNTDLGALFVTAVDRASDAIGVYYGPNSVVNAGLITVTSAQADAFGDVGVDYTAAATGFLTVQGADEAIGLEMSGRSIGGTVTNAGSIQVSGLHAFGVAHTTYLNNSGSILALSTGAGGDSTGVYLDTFGPTVSVINSGVITAQTAIQGAVGAAASGLTATILNTGTLDGAVNLGDGHFTLDSSAGTITGTVTLGTGADTVTLGAENNTVALAAGTHVVDGGGGTNTISYVSAASAVHVSLGLQGQAQNTGVGTDTLSDFQGLTGSPFADRLEGGGSAASTLTGGLGADTFVYRSGDGAVTVTDFSAAQSDRIDLSGLGTFANLNDVLAASSQVGSDTVIAIGSGSLHLQNVSMGALTAANFVFPGTETGTSANNYTATFDGVYRQYTVGAAGSSVTGGPEGGGDILSNIQRIQFVDGYLAVSPTDTAGQVYRLYEATLGRAPDQDGLVYWVDALNSGGSLQSAASSFVNSQEFQSAYGSLDNSHFVTLIYNNVLHRAPDAGGLSYWTNLLNTGQDSRAQVVTGFSESNEDITNLAAPIQQGLWIGNAPAAEVARLYDSVFGRLPDASGEAFWTNALQNGVSLQTAANGFVASTEFQSTYGALNNSDFVTQIYENVLHRGPDAGGLSYWVGQLSAGISRAQVVVGFSESGEHITNTAAHIDYGVWVTG